jgi:Transposase
VRDLACGDLRIYLDVEVRRVACRRSTKRFAFYVGRRGRASPIRDVAKELRVDRHTVKALEPQDMREPLRRAGTPGPRVLGLDEVSIKKGHTSCIVVSDRVRQRPIWSRGTDRSGGEPGLARPSRELDPQRPAGLTTLLAANQRLNTACLLKESFGQLWDYGREGWARRFFEHWRAALKWQRLRPYEKFAAMTERHWKGDCLLPPGERGRARVPRGAEPQDPRAPAPRIRAPGRRIPPAQDPHLHAAGDLTMPPYPQVPEITHTTSRRAGNGKRHSAPRDPWGGA